MSELIGIRECARRLNVSDTTVHKAIKNQRISIAGYTEKSNRPLVAWPQAGEDWAANSDPMKRTHIGGTGTSPRREKYSEPKTIKLETRAETLAGIKVEAPRATETVIPVSPVSDDPTQEPRLPDENTQIAPMATIAQSRQISEAYKAKLTKLEFEEKSGRLIDIEKVKAQAFKSARSIRDSLMNIPDRCAAELSAETDTSRVHARLSREIREILESLAGAPE